MKITAFLLFIAILQVSASTFAQKITLTTKNAPLVEVFNQIRTQTGYDFAFTSATLADAKPVSIDVKNAELNDVLKKIFEGQPLDYTIAEKSVVVSKKEQSFLDQISIKIKTALKSTADIGGHVTDTLGRPIVGATVYIKGTNNTTQTDLKGDFNFPALYPGKYTIVVSYIGYEKAEATIQLGDLKQTQAFILHLRTRYAAGRGHR